MSVTGSSDDMPTAAPLNVDVTILQCPLNGDPLHQEGDWLVSSRGERYPIIQGVPVLLVKTTDPTLWVVSASYDAARNQPDDPYHEGTIGCGQAEMRRLRERLKDGVERDVDPIISSLIGATSGYMYVEMVGSLPVVPIPDIRLPQGNGRLLDIGCNWGRWSVAAARKGYKVVGVDPSLGAVLAARRLADKMGLDAQFVVGDALHLPFRAGSFDNIFSYSVLQHFSYGDCAKAIDEAGRVSAPGASLTIQMPNVFGIRCLYHQARRRFREATGFAVRYYTPARLSRTFDSYGPNRLEVDGFFGLGIQPTDRPLVSGFKRRVIDASEILRGLSRWVPGLKYTADSLYVRATRQ